MSNEKYYVVSSGDASERLFFSLEDAKAFGSEYIDVFNAEGETVGGWNAIYKTDKNGRALVDENFDRIIVDWNGSEEDGAEESLPGYYHDFDMWQK